MKDSVDSYKSGDRVIILNKGWSNKSSQGVRRFVRFYESYLRANYEIEVIESSNPFFLFRKHLVIEPVHAFSLLSLRRHIIVHDMISYRWYSGVLRKLVLKLFYTIGFSFTEKIYCFTEVEKEFLERHFYVKRNKVEILLPSYSIPVVDIKQKGYWLIITNGDRHKGNQEVLDLFNTEELKLQKLVVLGLRMADTKNIRFMSRVTDNEYFDLIGSCRGIISNSYDEGFNLPIHDGVKMKKVVLARKLKVYDELYGNSIIYYDNMITLAKLLTLKNNF